MEGASSAQIAAAYNVPRILSNNKLNAGKYNPNTANQEYVYEVGKQYISTIK